LAIYLIKLAFIHIIAVGNERYTGCIV